MARKEKKYHFIYKTTNLLSGRYYIGMHSTNDLNDGYMGSGKRLKRSLNKYGKQNHKVEILEFLSSREELKKREKEIVTLNEIAKVECMNLMIGGEGGRGFTVKEAKKGRKKTNEILKNKYGNDFMKKVSVNFHKSLDDKSKKEWVDKIKEGIKDIAFGFFKGKKHSIKTKKKMRESKLGKGLGRDNSQFGTCWITKNETNKKIKKEELNHFISLGWNKGRKLKNK